MVVWSGREVWILPVRRVVTREIEITMNPVSHQEVECVSPYGLKRGRKRKRSGPDGWPAAGIPEPEGECVPFVNQYASGELVRDLGMAPIDDEEVGSETVLYVLELVRGYEARAGDHPGELRQYEKMLYECGKYEVYERLSRRSAGEHLSACLGGLGGIPIDWICDHHSGSCRGSDGRWRSAHEYS